MGEIDGEGREMRAGRKQKLTGGGGGRRLKGLVTGSFNLHKEKATNIW